MIDVNRDPNSTYLCTHFHFAVRKPDGTYHSACGASQLSYAADEGETVYHAQVTCRYCKLEEAFDNIPVIPLY